MSATQPFPDWKGPLLIIPHQHPLEVQQSCRQHGHAYSDPDLFSRKKLLQPLYLDGQIIWIHKQDTLEEGEIGIFFLDGEAYVKKYHQTDSGIQLISLNSKCSPINVSSESTLKTFSKVVG